MNKIYVNNKRTIRLHETRTAVVLDITSTSKEKGLKILSPFYPHGNIPVPGMPNTKAACVEGVWQGLKVFEGCGVDYATLRNDTMKDIKRTVRKYGKPLGHQYGDKILNYADARWLIYLPTYLYILENVPTVQHTLQKIKERLQEKDIVFLDYNTNCNVVDYSKPLSHAGLVKSYLEGNYPRIENRTKYEASFNARDTNISIEEIIEAIKKHPKFDNKKHLVYLEEIKSMDKPCMKRIVSLSGMKRDGWKTIVNDIQTIECGTQLSLPFCDKK